MIKWLNFFYTFSRHENQSLKVVKFDVEKEIPVRGPDGFCIPCSSSEAGELISEIGPGRAFAGYYGNKEGTNKKVLRDVFQRGDQYFRTGDLIRWDTNTGYFYFVDRIGDTFSKD